MHILLLTRQIGHYHDARYRGACGAFDRVTVVSTNGQGHFSELLANKSTGEYRVFSLYNTSAEYVKGVRSGRLRSDLEAILASVSPRVIAVAGWGFAETAIAIRWARNNDCAVIMMSESQEDDASRQGIREWVKKRVCGLCDAALVGGGSHASYIQKLGMASDKIFLGYNAVDNEHFVKVAAATRENSIVARAAFGLPGMYILASARFIEKKNLPALISAHSAVRKQSSSFPDLVVLGDGPYRDAIEVEVVSHSEPGSVHLLGFHGYEDLPKIYSLAEAFVHVSLTEQWGLVINEAMAAGVPVIVSNTCGASRTVVEHGVSGILTEPTPADIKNALTRFNEMSNSEREEMAKNGAEAIAEWGPERFGAGLRMAADRACSGVNQLGLSVVDKLVLVFLEKMTLTHVQ